jgi:hypothetical protein
MGASVKVAAQRMELTQVKTMDAVDTDVGVIGIRTALSDFWLLIT